MPPRDICWSRKAPASGEEEVGSPDAEEGAELALAGEGDADGREEVVDEDEQDGEDEAGGLAAALGGEAEGDADEHEDEAGEGVGEALVELDAVGAGGRLAGLGRVRWRAKELAEGKGEDGGVGAGKVGVVWAAVWMGRSVVVKVEMLYWLGSVGEIWCWPPSRRRRWRSPVGLAVTRAWSAVVTRGRRAG